MVSGSHAVIPAAMSDLLVQYSQIPQDKVQAHIVSTVSPELCSLLVSD